MFENPEISIQELPRADSVEWLGMAPNFVRRKLAENASAVLESIIKAKPSTAKGVYLRNIAVSSSMGPSVNVDTAGAAKLFG